MLVLVRDGNDNDRTATPFRGCNGENAVANPAQTKKEIAKVFASFNIAITPDRNDDGNEKNKQKMLCPCVHSRQSSQIVSRKSQLF